MRTRNCRRDLAEESAEVDLLSDRLDFQSLIERGQRIDAARQPIEVHRIAAFQIARLQPDQGDDKLQVVLHAMLQLLEQQILAAHIELQLVALRAFLLADVDQGCDTVVLGPVLVLDDAHITLHRPGRLPSGPFRKVPRKSSPSVMAAPSVSVASSSLAKPSRADQPLPFINPPSEPAQALEHLIDVDDAVGSVAIARDRNADRNVIEKCLEFVVLDGADEFRRGQDLLDLLGGRLCRELRRLSGMLMGRPRITDRSRLRK